MSRRAYKMIGLLAVIFLPLLSKAQVRCWDPVRKNVEWIKLDDNQSLRVLFFLSPDCPLCQNYTLTFNQLQKNYPTITFTGIVPGKAYTDKEVTDFIRKYKIGFPVYIDSSKNLSSLVKATVTPEAYLLRSEKKIFYYGSIDNWAKDLGIQSAHPTKFYLRDAIDRTLAGLPVQIPFNKPIGCLINDY